MEGQISVQGQIWKILPTAHKQCPGIPSWNRPFLRMRATQCFWMRSFGTQGHKWYICSSVCARDWYQVGGIYIQVKAWNRWPLLAVQLLWQYMDYKKKSVVVTGKVEHLLSSVTGSLTNVNAYFTPYMQVPTFCAFTAISNVTQIVDTGNSGISISRLWRPIFPCKKTILGHMKSSLLLMHFCRVW